MDKKYDVPLLRLQSYNNTNINSPTDNFLKEVVDFVGTD